MNKIVIIGAGPAGITASIFLSKKSIPHIVLDKAKFPRAITCGDVLSPKAINILSRIDDNVLQDLIEQKDICSVVEGISFYSPDNNHSTIPLTSHNKNLPFGIVSKRFHYDNYLFNMAKEYNPEIFDDTTVTDVYRNKGRIVVKYEQRNKSKKVDADLVIGADGHNSILFKNFYPEKANKSDYAIAARGYFENVSGIKPGILELHFITKYLPGYFWIFPMSDGISNVGITMMRKDAVKKKVKIVAELQNIINTHPKLKSRFANATIKERIMARLLHLGLKKRISYGDNFMLTGDAAALIDPFTQEGIGNAMLTGMLATETALLAIDKNDFSFKVLSNYQKSISNHLNKELRFSKRLHKLAGNPYYFNFVVNKLNGNESMRNLLGIIVSNPEQRSQILKSSLYKYVFK